MSWGKRRPCQLTPRSGFSVAFLSPRSRPGSHGPTACLHITGGLTVPPWGGSRGNRKGPMFPFPIQQTCLFLIEVGETVPGNCLEPQAPARRKQMLLVGDHLLPWPRCARQQLAPRPRWDLCTQAAIKARSLWDFPSLCPEAGVGALGSFSGAHRQGKQCARTILPPTVHMSTNR